MKKRYKNLLFIAGALLVTVLTMYITNPVGYISFRLLTLSPIIEIGESNIYRGYPFATSVQRYTQAVCVEGEGREECDSPIIYGDPTYSPILFLINLGFYYWVFKFVTSRVKRTLQREPTKEII